jgi:hypothetical protein
LVKLFVKIQTFSDAERAAGFTYVRPADMSKLEAWYDSRRDVPFEALTMDDLCIACRQDVYVGELQPRIVRDLADDLLAGHVDEGELLRSFAKALPPLERPFSADLIRLRQNLRKFVSQSQGPRSDPENQAAAMRLLANLGE